MGLVASLKDYGEKTSHLLKGNLSSSFPSYHPSPLLLPLPFVLLLLLLLYSSLFLSHIPLLFTPFILLILLSFFSHSSFLPLLHLLLFSQSGSTRTRTSTRSDIRKRHQIERRSGRHLQTTLFKHFLQLVSLSTSGSCCHDFCKHHHLYEDVSKTLSQVT
jgi:hypothetical protein